ncbi:MAG: LysR family transcriptional regulator [Rhodobacteraceae bacterium]|nr:LysR family transcriptional regulator [Paracoccaceae bacterium]
MEMHQVRYFLAVCKAENFTRAAEACNVAQPSLTKAVRKLEEEFGGPLFHRERNRSILTELGRRVKPHIDRMAEASMAAKQDAAGFFTDGAVKVRLGVMSTIAPTRMVGFLMRLREEVPQLELELKEDSGTALIAAMTTGELDVALMAMPTLPNTLHAMPLYPERYVVAFPAGHAFQQRNAISIETLKGVDYLTRVHCEFMDHYEALGDSRPLTVNVRYSSEREDWVQAMVVAGLGCSIMPEHLPSMDGISTRPLKDPTVSRCVSLVTVAGRQHSPALAAMVRVAKRHVWPVE